MVLRRAEGSFSFLFFLSMVSLVLVVVRLWLIDRGPLPFWESYSSEPTFQLTVQLEEAKISKIGSQGKEWELQAQRIEQREREIYLEEIQGTVFQKNIPLYRLQAKEGKISLVDNGVVLQVVELREERGDTVIKGEKLSFLSQEQEFLLDQAKFYGKKIKACCGKLIYNVARRKMIWEDQVEIQMELSK